jgi:hypothetical protein
MRSRRWLYASAGVLFALANSAGLRPAGNGHGRDKHGNHDCSPTRRPIFQQRPPVAGDRRERDRATPTPKATRRCRDRRNEMPWLGLGGQQGDAAAVHLLEPWIVTSVAKVHVIDACRSRDAVKLQRIECVGHLFKHTRTPSVVASAGNVAIAPKRVGCFETMSASCSLIRLASWQASGPFA